MIQNDGTAKGARHDDALGNAPGLPLHWDAVVASLPGFVFRREMSALGKIAYPYFTETVEGILGFSPQAMEVNAAGCLHVVHWADRDAHLSAVRHSAQTLSACDEEFRAITYSGEVRWLKGRSHPHRLDDGSITWDGVLIDVTDAKRAELRLDMLMEHAQDCIMVLGDNGRIESVNAAAGRMFGHAPGVLLGQALTGLVVEIMHRPDLLELSAEEGGLTDGGPRELTGIRADGSLFPLELTTTEIRQDGQRLFVTIGRDITQRKATEAALHETEQRLRAVAANMPGMVFQRVLRTSGRLEYSYVSEGCRLFLGVEPVELVEDPELFLTPLANDERQTFLTNLNRSARTLEPFEEEMVVVGGDGRRRWLRGQSRPSRRANGDVVWDGVMIDITGRKMAEQRLSFVAYYDPLTRLPNRTAFLERFVSAREAARQSGTLVAILSLGIDRFGIINATMGHAVGDQVLIAVGDRLQAAIGRDDVLARATGDRFLLLLAGHCSKRDLMDMVEHIHSEAQRSVEVGEDEFDVSASTGIAVFPRDGDDAETLIKHAEAALQRAKSQGAGTLQVFTKEMSARATKTLSLRSRLRRGLDNGEFIPYFQPQVDLTSGHVVGMEGLVRWKSPDMGMVAPGDFIPIAEESGLIDGICDVMLEACAHQNKLWQDKGLPAIPVAVNVSGRQFQAARRLIQALESTLSRSGLDPRYLEIELTESSAMRDADNAISVVQQLKDMGIASAIDDFGTGYSSLSVLKRFPIQKLKIDKSFVMDVITDPNDAAIVDAIVAMARALRLKVVAEGVEHVRHLEFLRTLGCDQMQGYLFSRPLPAHEMEALLIERRQLQIPVPVSCPV